MGLSIMFEYVNPSSLFRSYHRNDNYETDQMLLPITTTTTTTTTNTFTLPLPVLISAQVKVCVVEGGRVEETFLIYCRKKYHMLLTFTL